MKMNAITYFTKEFLVQGTVSIRSLSRVEPDTTIYALCIDQVSFDYLSLQFNNTNVVPVNLIELPEINKLFETLVMTRTFFESLITLKPFILEYFLSNLEESAYLIYFDADLYFYESFSTKLLEISDFDLLLSQHLFPHKLRKNVYYGKFNAGFLVFKSSTRGRRLLHNWKKMCLADCSLVATDSVYGDQKYLQQFENSIGVQPLQDPGINNGQYYFQSKRIIKRNSATGSILVDDFPLICFHFHGIRINAKFIQTGFNRYNKPFGAIRVFRFIYLPYIDKILIEIALIVKAIPDFLAKNVLQDQVKSSSHTFRSILRFTILPTCLYRLRSVKPK
jgi:hypothetical protein